MSEEVELASPAIVARRESALYDASRAAEGVRA